MEVASELCVDEVVDQRVDQGSAHGHQVDAQVHLSIQGRLATSKCEGHC